MYATINAKSSCFYCECCFKGNIQPTIEHLRPTSLGGKEEGNLVYACGWCNSRRGNQSFIKFFIYIQELKRQINTQGNCTSCLEKLRFRRSEIFNGVFICGNCRKLKDDNQINNISELRELTENKRYRNYVNGKNKRRQK